MVEKMTFNEAGDDIDNILKSYNLMHQEDEDGGSYNLSDALTPPGEDTVKLGLEEIGEMTVEILHYLVSKNLIQKHLQLSEQRNN